ncbi:hypothetical protein BIY24_10350 [Halobacteriovorax marinus]|uniref:hypothetical protein n=1 Tax=Halobacteriovorax marinus TaxID=97084 RepID=UPI000BC328EE|nr:hypothetical protein [Halobacteriovorax marinus]ATH08333.1 hypothetical protein BIY24_10350 [Halobacteriovorax marinus]
MTDKNAQLIHEITYSFYEVATKDFLIGYQFRKIQEFKSSDPLSPPIEAFKNHLPRIEKFWRVQLIGERLTKEDQRFDLINIHKSLKPNKGEVLRWVKLFNETLDQYEDESNRDFIKLWRKKVSEFEKRFLTFLF